METWHLIQQLLVLGFEVLTDGPELFPGLATRPEASALGADWHEHLGCWPSPPGTAWGPGPAPLSPQYLVELGQHGPRLLLLLVFLHLGLQPPVVLQGLLPPFHGHVEAWEDTAEPVATQLIVGQGLAQTVQVTAWFEHLPNPGPSWGNG